MQLWWAIKAFYESYSFQLFNTPVIMTVLCMPGQYLVKSLCKTYTQIRSCCPLTYIWTEHKIYMHITLHHKNYFFKPYHFQKRALSKGSQNLVFSNAPKKAVVLIICHFFLIGAIPNWSFYIGRSFLVCFHQMNWDDHLVVGELHSKQNKNGAK